MKYSFKYYIGCPHMREVDEVIIKYTEQNENIVQYAEDFNKKQRLVIDLTYYKGSDFGEFITKDSLRYLLEAHNRKDNLAVICYAEDGVTVAFCKEYGIPFFFRMVPNSEEEVNDLVKIGVSDIYVGNDMGFNLKFFAEIKEKNPGLILRAYPNVSQRIEEEEPSIKTFFIRPEDVKFYEKYIDVLEFFGTISKQSALYNIYKSGKWEDDLSILILELNEQVLNQTITPTFAEVRSDCKKRCKDGRCNCCQKIVDICKVMKEKGYKYDKG